MKYYLFLFIYIFFSCASQGSPIGGPIDNTGPKVVNVIPEDNSISSNDDIVIFFDELINPITVVNAIEIFPQNDFSYRISGKKIIITPKINWNRMNVLKVKLSRYISDYQNNSMSSPVELFYFNSDKLSNKQINGNIFSTDKNIFELGLYEIRNSNYTLIEKTESNQNGAFQFKYLDSGKYFIAAVSDSLININSDIREKRYGMITSSFIDLINNDTIYTDIKIDFPLERLSIQSFEQFNNHFGYITYNNGKQDPFLIPQMDDSILDDSILINVKLKNRLESYSVNYPVKLINMIDTLPPAIKSFNTLNDSSDIILSEPIKYSSSQNSPIIFYLKDSTYHTIDYNIINPFTIRLPLRQQLISEVLVTNLIDLYDNTLSDTLLLSIDSNEFSNDNIQGGSVYGSLIYDGENLIVIKAENIDSDTMYYTFSDDNNEFYIPNIKPGFYTFTAFEFFGGYDSIEYFSGLWDPISRAAKFSMYPEVLEIRKHWDIKDMVIEIK